MTRPFLIALAWVFATGCGPDERILRSGKETPAPTIAEIVKASFARDFDEINTAKFTFVYVVRRKDGGKLDAEDRGIIRTQTVDMNRRVVSDEDKAAIIGSNFQLPQNNMAVLLSRFSVVDYSTLPATGNTGSNKK